MPGSEILLVKSFRVAFTSSRNLLFLLFVIRFSHLQYFHICMSIFSHRVCLCHSCHSYFTISVWHVIFKYCRILGLTKLNREKEIEQQQSFRDLFSLEGGFNAELVQLVMDMDTQKTLRSEKVVLRSLLLLLFFYFLLFLFFFLNATGFYVVY